MRILITGSLVFLLWAFFASWFYVCKIKPYCEMPVSAADAPLPASPPTEPEIPKPENFVVYFDYNMSDFNASSLADQQTLLFSNWLGKHPEATLTVTGHADSRGPDAYNQSLGTKRAENTLSYLTGKGISPEKIKTISKGEKEPVSDNTSDEGRAKNRRAEITLN